MPRRGRNESRAAQSSRGSSRGSFLNVEGYHALDPTTQAHVDAWLVMADVDPSSVYQLIWNERSKTVSVHSYVRGDDGRFRVMSKRTLKPVQAEVVEVKCSGPPWE